MTCESKRRLRALFALTLVLFVLQMLFIHLRKEEPYPAVTMPGFGGHPTESGEITVTEPVVTVHFADGQTRTVAPQSLLPRSTTVIASSVLRTAFGDESTLRNPQTTSWLRDRVSALFPSEQVAGLDIAWQTETFDVNKKAPTTVSTGGTNHVDFAGAQ